MQLSCYFPTQIPFGFLMLEGFDASQSGRFDTSQDLFLTQTIGSNENIETTGKEREPSNWKQVKLQSQPFGTK